MCYKMEWWLVVRLHITTHHRGHTMLRLTRDEAADHLGMSLNTLDRRIKAGLVQVEHTMVGLQRRVVVLIPETEEEGEVPEPVSRGPLPFPGMEIAGDRVSELEDELEAERTRVSELEEALESERHRIGELEKELAVADERSRGLESLVETLKEQVTMERERYSQIYHDFRPMLMAPQDSQDSDEPRWWKFWSR